MEEDRFEAGWRADQDGYHVEGGKQHRSHVLPGLLSMGMTGLLCWERIVFVLMIASSSRLCAVGWMDLAQCGRSSLLHCAGMATVHVLILLGIPRA